MLRSRPSIFAIHVALCIASAFAAPAFGANPSSGTISPSSTALSWSGGPVTGSTTDPLGADCSNSPCDLFTLTVAGTDPSIHTITVRIDWLSPTNDLDLHVIDATTGAVVQSSGEAVSNFEQLSFTANPGTYTVQVLFYRSVAESYTGNAALVTGPAPEPPNQFRTATYQNFDFQFTPEVELPEQRRSQVFIDQDIEPEIEVDRFGTIYIGAIRGVPGGVDFWRSDNGGASFQYLGQPDGTQNPSPNPPSPEGGVGGGDVDIAMGDPFDVVPSSPAGPAIKSTGRLYCTSLWLGSATLSVSLDRGENWVATPFTTAQLDRQWNLGRGEKTLYMSLRKLGQLVAGQNDVYVAQSDDGLTFTKGSFVQDPLGENVPDDVGGNSVLTSDGRLYGTFVSEDGKDLYLWRTRSVPADLPLGPLDAPVFVPNSFDVGLIFHGVGSLTTNNTFPIMTVDKADNLHIAFGDRTNIYLISCAAGADPTAAANWTLPVPLNAPKLAGFEYTRTTMFPWIRGGEPGRLAAIWYATDVMGDPDTPVFEQDQVPWRLVYAQVEDALAATPRVYLQVASQQGGGVIHTGQICVRGTGCPSGTRELAEYSSVTIDNEGFANIAYSGTLVGGQNPTDMGAITFFTKTRARPLVTPPVTAELECHDPAISRKGGWHDVHDGRATNGSYCRNVGSNKGGSSGAFIEFQYNGTQLDVQIARGPRGGNAELIVDGVSRGKLDFFRPPSDPGNPDRTGRRDLTFGEFVTLETGAGNHTFRLEVLNDSPLTDRDMIYVDGFVVRGGAAQGAGNPTESSTMVEGTVAPSALPLTGAVHPVTALSSTILLTGVLEMEDGANLDLALLDPNGAVLSLAETASAVETARRAPFGAGGYSFVVMNRGTAPASYRLHLVSTELSGPPTVTAVPVAAHAQHENLAAVQPFGAEASLSFTVSKPGPVTIRVFNISGQVVRTFARHQSAAGRNAVRWDGRFDDGQRAASGVYFYRVQHGDGSVSKHRTAILR